MCWGPGAIEEREQQAVIDLAHGHTAVAVHYHVRFQPLVAASPDYIASRPGLAHLASVAQAEAADR